jgi:hypothetical protein
MAKIWPVYEGREPTVGEPWAQLPVTEAVALLELRARDRVSDFERTPRFGDARRDLWYLGYRHVVLEIEPNEALNAAWKPGFYRSRLKPREVLIKLIERAVMPALGRENLVRVALGIGIDSQGSRALKATIVVPPEATSRFSDKSILDTIVRVQQLGEIPTMVVEFATEAELARASSA